MTGRPPDQSQLGASDADAEPDARQQVVHIPVLVDAVLAALAPRDDALYVDATFGTGGYSMALLGAARCRVVGIDRDPDAVRRGRNLAERLGGRLTIIQGRFGEMVRLLASIEVGPIAGIAFDLGVSSVQLDRPERGFSFRFDGPLDMRMSGEGPSAADLIASLSERQLAKLIGDFGEERFARRVARAITAARHSRPIRGTIELAEIVRAAVPKPEPGQDPATRTFQALRIAVNDELGELDRGLVAAEQLLMHDGRLAVVSFHSLEDRRVKRFLQRRGEGASRASRHVPDLVPGPEPSFKLLGRRAIKPDPAEIGRNPRARAARLRVAQRNAAPAWPAGCTGLNGRRKGQGA
jgi:16S rRNA (cytosine1402-N4)-methyltransferase